MNYKDNMKEKPKNKKDLLYKLLGQVADFELPDNNLRVKLGLYPDFNFLTYRKANNG